MSRDIVHAQRGFRRRSCGDIVRRFTGGVSFPMDWETKIQRFTGNEIRFADEIHRWWTISPPQAGTISAPAERTEGKSYLNRGGGGGG